MGLSDKERRSGLYFAAKELVKINKDWKEEESRKKTYYKDLSSFHNLIDQIYPAIYCSQANGLHWFMGSSASNLVQHEEETTSPWEIAILSHVEGIRQERGWKDWNKGLEKPFSGVKWCSIEKVLPFPQNKVFQTYQYLEHIVYYLRRYNDDFLESYKELSNIVSKLFGECFEEFSRDSIYAKAYLTAQIVKMLYSKEYPYENDFVDELFQKHCFHHQFHAEIMKLSLNKLTKIHIVLAKYWVFCKNPKDFQKIRLSCALRFGKSNFGEYEHNFKDIENRIKPEFPDLIPLMNRLRIVYNKNKEKEKDKDTLEYQERDFAVHGFDAYKIAERAKEQFVEKPVEKVVKPKKKAVKKPGKKK